MSENLDQKQTPAPSTTTETIPSTVTEIVPTTPTQINAGSDLDQITLYLHERTEVIKGLLRRTAGEFYLFGRGLYVAQLKLTEDRVFTSYMAENVDLGETQCRNALKLFKKISGGNLDFDPTAALAGLSPTQALKTFGVIKTAKNKVDTPAPAPPSVESVTTATTEDLTAPPSVESVTTTTTEDLTPPPSVESVTKAFDGADFGTDLRGDDDDVAPEIYLGSLESTVVGLLKYASGLTPALYGAFSQPENTRLIEVIEGIREALKQFEVVVPSARIAVAKKARTPKTKV